MTRIRVITNEIEKKEYIGKSIKTTIRRLFGRYAYVVRPRLADVTENFVKCDLHIKTEQGSERIGYIIALPQDCKNYFENKEDD